MKSIKLPVVVQCENCHEELPATVILEDGTIFIEIDLEKKKIKKHECK